MHAHRDVRWRPARVVLYVHVSVVLLQLLERVLAPVLHGLVRRGVPVVVLRVEFTILDEEAE